MIQVKTKEWPVKFWWKVIEWCEETWGPCQWNKTWFFRDDFTLFIHERYIPFFVLKWNRYEVLE